jgi:hypothetical protein
VPRYDIHAVINIGKSLMSRQHDLVDGYYLNSLYDELRTANNRIEELEDKLRDGAKLIEEAQNIATRVIERNS